jgi:hypothetical protein
MDDINNIQDDNLGGNELVRFAPIEFFSVLSTATFLAGYDWINLYCTSESVLFNEKKAVDAGGKTTDLTITGSIPKIRPDISAKIDKYCNRPLIVECQDNNGNLRRSGVSGRVIMLDQASTGTDVSDTNGYQVQFAGKQLKPSLFI